MEGERIENGRREERQNREELLLRKWVRDRIRFLSYREKTKCSWI